MRAPPPRNQPDAVASSASCSASSTTGPTHIVTSCSRGNRAGELSDRFRWALISQRDPIWHLLAARRASRACDVLLSTNSYLTAWFSTIPTVCVVCDLIPFNRTLHPRARSVVAERLTLGLATRRAAGFIAISAATEHELLERFPRCRGRTTVALLGASDPEPAGGDEPPTDLNINDGFVLAVGTVEPRKNLTRLVAAFAQLPLELQSKHPLVVVGPVGWQANPALRELAALGDRVHVLGYVSDATLEDLYRRCGVFCYPSLGEGFGLPVLEAMAAGAPVVTSSVPALVEVGGSAVELADPLEVESIAAALRRVLEHPARADELRALGRARSATFSWARFAQTTLEALEQVAGRGATR